MATIIAAGFAVSTAFAGDAPNRCDSLVQNVITASCTPPGTACDPAVRLERFAAWLRQKEEPCSTIVAAVAERNQTLHDTMRYPIDTAYVTFVGLPTAANKIIMYVSATCPLCKRVYHDLYDSVTAGSLKGRARLGIKPFSARPWDVALLASRDFGKQADLMRSLAVVTERISMTIIMSKADSIGIPKNKFVDKINSAPLKSAAEASYREAVRNGVTTTPTIFINNRRYKSYKDPRWVVDAVEYLNNKRR